MDLGSSHDKNPDSGFKHDIDMYINSDPQSKITNQTYYVQKLCSFMYAKKIFETLMK